MVYRPQIGWMEDGIRTVEGALNSSFLLSLHRTSLAVSIISIDRADEWSTKCGEEVSSSSIHKCTVNVREPVHTAIWTVAVYVEL